MTPQKPKHGAPGGEAHPLAKLTEYQVRDIRRRRARGELCRDIAALFGIGRGHVSQIATRKLWKDVK